jgi:hypothetical protein
MTPGVDRKIRRGSPDACAGVGRTDEFSSSGRSHRHDHREQPHIGLLLLVFVVLQRLLAARARRTNAAAAT